MQAIEIWEFFDDKQRMSVLEQEYKIKRKLSFPVFQSQIEQELSTSKLKEVIHEIDPTLQTLRSRLSESNKSAFLVNFKQLTEEFFIQIDKSIDFFEKQLTIRYLEQQFALLMRNKFNVQNYKWKEQSIIKGSLWERLNTEVKSVVKGAFEFLIKYFQLENFPEVQLDNTMSIFEKTASNAKKKFHHLHIFEDIGRQEVEIKIEEEDEEQRLNQLIRSFEIVEKEKELEEQLEKQKLASKQKPSFFGYLMKSSQDMAGNIGKMFYRQEAPAPQKSEREEIKQIPKKEVKEETKKADLQKEKLIFLELTEEQKKIAQKISLFDLKKLIQMVAYQFSNTDKKKIEYAINEPLLKWQADEVFITGSNQLAEVNGITLMKLKKSLLNLVGSIKLGNDNHQDKFFPFLALVFRQLAKEYSPLTKTYLSRVCENIETAFGQDCPYLRGILKIYQTAEIKPSDEAIRLIGQQTPDKNFRILKEKEQVKFEKLNSSNSTKNVYFLVNGFLSEEKEQNNQWAGLLSRLRETELYGVIWRSSSKMQLAKNLIVNSGSFAMSSPGVTGLKLPPFVRMAQMGISLKNRFIFKQSGPQETVVFSDAMTRAAHAGRQLADKLIAHFSDRHVTLIGFSLGAEVIRVCLQRLAERKQLKLLLKIITFGGAVDQEQLEKTLWKCSSAIIWFNFQSKNDYVGRFLYRGCIFGSQPIGLSGVKWQSGHFIQNFDVSELVQSHMEFINTSEELFLMTNSQHD